MNENLEYGDGIALTSISHPVERKFSIWQRLRMFLFGSEVSLTSTERVEMFIGKTLDETAEDVLNETHTGKT